MYSSIIIRITKYIMNNPDLKICEVLFPNLKKYSKQDLENLILELKNLDWSTISEHEIKRRKLCLTKKNF